MKHIYIGIGISGSGKSTYIKNMVKMIDKHQCFYLNADSIREELYGDPKIQGDGSKVFSILFERLNKALWNPAIRYIFIDNISLKARDRREYYKKIERYKDEYEIHLLYFKSNLNRALKWNQQRDKVVPDEVIISQSNRLQPPTEEEKAKYDVTTIEFGE